MSKQKSRRRILEYGVWSLLTLIGSALATVLGAAIVAPSFLKREEDWLDVGGVDSFGKTPQRFDVIYRHRQGWFEEERTDVVYGYRRPDGDIVVLSSVCTHLGCSVRWDSTAKTFQCPCHGGVYDATGQVISGPPENPLAGLKVRIDNKRILILKV